MRQSPTVLSSLQRYSHDRQSKKYPEIIVEVIVFFKIV